MRRVWGFAFFCFAVGMIVDYLLEGFVNFAVCIVSFAMAYILFFRCED